ncbi:hypothetical protein WJX73_004278 [Symbiochloris irregularis]|uniref:Uncharacterized protein n=1 Tax=Symbiochloris irregularis TaxID=706552 RepID=A0AAW1NX87_9CHLO
MPSKAEKSSDCSHINLNRPLPRATRPVRSSSRLKAADLDFDSLLFDCDGVLVDTEAQGHRVAFNQAFQQKGLNVEWPLELYGELLHTGGGKERMTRHFTELGDKGPFSGKDEAQQQELVKELHLLKTDLFMKMIEEGQMPLRTGVQRLISEAIAAGIKVAVCSTSNERAVSKIRDVLLGPDIAAKMQVYAGDIVPKKKPDPAVYLLAAKELSVDPSRCVVVEDSGIGLKAATSAGMRCLVTTSSYTKDEDFSKASAVVPELGDKVTLESLTTEGLASLA